MQSPWGSLNWRGGSEADFKVGEVVGAPRPWRDGSRPANACGGGGGPVTVPCQPLPLPLTMWATLTVNGQSEIFPLNNSGNVWTGDSKMSVGICSPLHVSISCEEVVVPPGLIDFRWQLRTQANVGPVVADDGAGFNKDLPVPLVFDADLPNLTATCLPAPTGLAHLRITENMPTRVALALR